VCVFVCVFVCVLVTTYIHSHIWVETVERSVVCPFKNYGKLVIHIFISILNSEISNATVIID